MGDLKEFYTQQEADALVENLKKVFPVVRILKENEVGGLSKISELDHPCHCFEFWGKHLPCENCSSMKTLTDHKDRTKIEYLDDTPFQVYSIYMNIDGKNSVLEILKEISNISVDPDDIHILANKLLNLNNKFYKDSLTGTYNRAYYDDRKDKLIDSAGIAFIDIDDFKNINDIYGHEFGDVVLRDVAAVLLKNVRADDAVIRYGGDEFVLVLSHINEDTFYMKLERIRSSINDLVLPEHNKVRLSVSIGATMCENQKLHIAVNEADKYMFTSKQHHNMVSVSWKEQVKKEEPVVADENKLFVLIVDDSDINRVLLKSMLEDKYRILEASDGKQATMIVDDYRQNISAILLDIEMPNMGGFEFLNYLKYKDFNEDIPVIMISSDNNDDIIIRSYELGAIDYISRPYNAKIVERRIDNIIKLFLRQRQFKREIRQQINRTDATSRMMSIIFSYIVGYRNHESGPHVLHVEQITEILLEKLVEKDHSYFFTEYDKKNIVAASGMHDIGKLGIDEKILNKPGKLTEAEFEEVKQHTLIGARMLQSMELYRDEPLVKYAYNICRWHHERYDGKGYPDGLIGDEIPIEAQIVSLADVYDALVSKRVYKDEYTHVEALNLILNGECGKFNPLLIECLLDAKGEIKNTYLELEKQKEDTDNDD